MVKTSPAGAPKGCSPSCTRAASRPISPARTAFSSLRRNCFAVTGAVSGSSVAAVTSLPSALLAPCGTGPPTPAGTGRALDGGSPMWPGPAIGHRSGNVMAMWSCIEDMACRALARWVLL